MHRPRPDEIRQNTPLILAAILAALLFTGCSSKNVGYKGTGRSTEYADATQRPYVIKNVKYYPIPDATGFRERGLASWYGDYFHGRLTSNGETYDMYAMTAAHKILPMDTVLRVRNLENGREVTVRVNDRGPFVDGRVIDLSFTAAEKLGIVGPGTARVEIAALPPTILRPENTSPPAEKSPAPGVLTAVSQPVKRPAPPEAEAVSPPPPATPSGDTLQVSSTSRTRDSAHEDAESDASTAVQPAPTRQESQPGRLYYVRVGRFFDVEQAQSLKRRFTDAGHAAVVDTRNDSGQQSYHVHVFAGRQLASAKQAEAELLAQGYTGASVVIR